MDTAFTTHPFAAYTSAEIKAFILSGNGRPGMIAELRRRNEASMATVTMEGGWRALPPYDVERAKHY